VGGFPIAEEDPMRLRITFSKTDALRYTGHLDLHSIWERTIRRAGLPLAYTQGFHPGPKIQLASALPLGFIGRAEVLDLWINEPGDAPDRPFQEILQPAAPPGLVISSVEVVDEHGPALQTQVISAEYEVSLLEPRDSLLLEESISSLLGSASIPRERRGKPYDLRPLIESLSLASTPLPKGEGVELRVLMTLAAREGATGRPEEVLDVLGIPVETTRIERTRLILR
jgi:radical SAM-linked protein